MITISLKQKTKKNGHLILDVPTSLKEKDVEVILMIQEKNDVIPGATNKEKKKKINTIFQTFTGNWNGKEMH